MRNRMPTLRPKADPPSLKEVIRGSSLAREEQGKRRLHRSCSGIRRHLFRPRMRLPRRGSLVFWLFLIGEVSFLIGIYVLGAEWWGKFRRIFVWEAADELSVSSWRRTFLPTSSRAN